MTGTRVAYEMNDKNNEQAILKTEKIFEKIDDSISLIKPLAQSAKAMCSKFPQFEDDVDCILSACDLFSEIVIIVRTALMEKINAGELQDDQLKEARHDLRAKVGAILGYSELIQEELMDEVSECRDSYAKILSNIGEQAKNLIPIIDGLRLDEVVQSENYSTNEKIQNNLTLSDANLTYGQQFAHCTVLIIDDSTYNREILSRRLSRYGVNVLTAENGAKGLEVVGQKSVDLILLDIMMPVMNGYEVLTNLKGNTATKDIPVLMISALSEVDSIVRCIEVGAEDYLPTPFNPVVLHARIKACLEKKILRDREQENIEKLELARQKLETAIESIEDGFAVFDKEHRLSLCNKPFQELYPGVEKLGFHGFTYEDLLRENLKLHVYFEERRRIEQINVGIDEEENWIRLQNSHQKAAEPYLIRLRDGRWIEVVNSFTPDGGQVSVHKDVTNRKEDEDRLTYQASHDSLTGLANRAEFENCLSRSFDSVKGTNEKFAVMFLDLDGFKSINDTLGHEVGDQVLIYVGEALKKCIRTQDRVARLGGDEFAIILNAPGTGEDMTKIADRVLESVGDHYLYEGQLVPYGVSIGIACYPEDGTTPEALLASSDTAMYTAKKSGKGHYRFYSEIGK